MTHTPTPEQPDPDTCQKHKCPMLNLIATAIDYSLPVFAGAMLVLFIVAGFLGSI
jgi:hypothetical protein